MDGSARSSTNMVGFQLTHEKQISALLVGAPRFRAANPESSPFKTARSVRKRSFSRRTPEFHNQSAASTFIILKEPRRRPCRRAQVCPCDPVNHRKKQFIQENLYRRSLQVIIASTSVSCLSIIEHLVRASPQILAKNTSAIWRDGWRPSAFSSTTS